MQQLQEQQPEQTEQQFDEIMLPVRTGASRRQRRLRMIQHHDMQDLKELQPSQDGVRPGRKEWRASRQGQQQLPQKSSPEEVASLSGSECTTNLHSDLARGTLDSLPDLGADTLDSLPSIVFDPTPECTPLNSPRRLEVADAAYAFSVCPPLQVFSPTSFYGLEGRMQVEATEGAVSQPLRELRQRTPQEGDCEELLRQLDASDGAVRALAMRLVTETAWPLAASSAGCRVVQRALDLASRSESIALVEQLKGRVVEASMCPNANHVLQKCVELLPPEHLHFVAEELQGQFAVAARHRYGCRVLERLIERKAYGTDALVAEVLADANQLCRHPFGNFVVQHVLKLGAPAQRRAIAEALHTDIQRLARHRVASHVVRCALTHAAAEDRHLLVRALTADPDDLADLAHHHCGSYVVRQLRKDVRRQ